MSERDQRSRIVSALKRLDARSVENRVGPGTPDVNHTLGWMELKWMKRWPKNCEESPVLLKHYTQQQRVWARRRKEKGGMVHLMLQVGREWLLFDGDVAAKVLGRVTRTELVAAAERYWPEGLKDKELVSWLMKSLES